jgi:beta-1,4-N-acetylglucosaminyltransferase
VILVTVGTTMPFDELIEAMDRLTAQGSLLEPVVCQIGNGRYEPGHCEYFRFKPSLAALTREASLVIGHGGTGTVLSLLAERKPFIAVVNPRGANDHQGQFLERLSRVVSILWTRDFGDLPALIERAREFKVEAMIQECLADDLRKFLQEG